MPLAHRPTIGRPAANSPAMCAVALAKRTSAAQSAQAGAWISLPGRSARRRSARAALRGPRETIAGAERHAGARLRPAMISEK